MRTSTAGLPPLLARLPVRVLTTRDAAEVYAEPRPQLHRLTERGVLQRLAPGLFAVVPPERVGTEWVPPLEATAAAVGAALYGQDAAVLVGLGAARLHGAVPRALAEAIVAVPVQHRPLHLRGGRRTVRFAKRHVERLDAELTTTEMGRVLVATIEQTVLDLAAPGVTDLTSPGVLQERAAIEALLPRAHLPLLERLATEQRLTSALTRAQEVVQT